MRTALDETRGRDGLVYLDVLGVLGPITSTSRGPEARLVQGLLAMPGMSTRKLPLWVSFFGGAALEVDLRVPLETLTSASGILGFFGRGEG